MSLVAILRALIPNDVKTAVLLVGLSFVIFATTFVVYQLFLNPLRVYPGPILSAATPFPYLAALVKGELNYYIHQVHKEYGDVVRVAPYHLSYCSGKAWKDIYERRQGYAFLEKEPTFYMLLPNGVHSIVTAPHAMHGRMRRLFSHAFAEKSLRDQEPLIKVYIDLLTTHLESIAEKGEYTNLVSWLDWTMFDIIGDLTFGEPFGCLENRHYHPWIEMLFSNAKLPTFFSAATFFPGLSKVIMLLLPPGLKEDYKGSFTYTTEKVQERLKKQTDRADFMTRVMEHNNDKNGMTVSEIESSSNHIIAGGAESTASTLAGGVFYLLKNREALEKLTTEIRQAFKSEDEITLNRIFGLPYLGAVVSESLRLYPPFSLGFPRIVPPTGEILLDKHVPGGTIVSVNNYATYHSERNFLHSTSFVPERFLEDPLYKSDSIEALQPFSVGPRNCIGKNLAYFEMRLILARLFFSFDLELRQDCEDWVSGQRHYMAWEKPPLFVKLKKVTRNEQ